MTDRLIARAALLVALAVSAAACAREAERRPAEREPAGAAAEGPPPVAGDTVTTASGLKYIVIRSGDGPAVQAGQVARVHYTGWLTDGRKFDSSRDRGQPFAFPVGQGRVIRGWDEAVGMMHVGDVWRLIIPPGLGYGERGFPGAIPPNATLIFDVELLGVGG